jgi:hypothetical protein
VACIWSGDKETILNSEGISWLRARNMKIRDLHCEIVTFDMAVKIAGFGVYLEWLDINNRFVSDISMIKIAENCLNIKHISMAGCSNITDLSMIRIAECCRHIKSLDAGNFNGSSNVTDIGMVRIIERCSNIERLRVRGCKRITDVSLIRIAECSHDIIDLDIGNCGKFTNDCIVR